MTLGGLQAQVMCHGRLVWGAMARAIGFAENSHFGPSKPIHQ
jgi:hypothetical protein